MVLVSFTWAAVAMECEKLSTPSILSSLKKLRFLLDRRAKIKILFIVGSAFVVSLLEVVITFFILTFMQVINSPNIGTTYLMKIGIHEQKPSSVVFFVSLIVGLTYLIKNAVVVVETFLQNFSIQSMNCDFKTELLSYLQNTSYERRIQKNSVSTLELIGSDVEQMFTVGISSLALSFSELLSIFTLLLFVFFINFKVALFAFIVLLSFGVPVRLYLFKNFYLWGKSLQLLGLEANKILLSMLHGLKEVILLHKSAFFIQRYSLLIYKKSRILGLQASVSALPRVFLEIIFMIIIISIAWSYSYFDYAPEEFLSLMGACAYVGFRIVPGVNRVIGGLNNFKSAIPSIFRIHQELLLRENDPPLENCPDFFFSSRITLSQVSFSYINNSKFSLEKVDLEIKIGESIGVIGKTGSGKSTLIDVILGLLKPHHGTVFVDGKYPVNSYQWHKKIGYVPQNIHLIDDTVEANIAFGEDEIDRQRLSLAIDAAQLRWFIDNLPEGEKTIVGERGVRLSGGERQRIAIARALYRNPEVLIFDEATSALDNETEEKLMETIRAVSKNRTVIMIAHRLTTLKDCDRIIVMEKGKIKKVTQYDSLPK